ncbi:hypothetical protein [Streptomyces griseocarneus]|uniref:Uncharacterized protein n=1 Tax=Streptomyces griseocarneus TaxID=51201 RepID=A0ABX7RI50_9ACTN|nr:hypothetical protein [Streptomyces griseocarneus]QSY47914.1 hypothetical protein J3S04_22060 [Streptomyces griseocarneus]
MSHTRNTHIIRTARVTAHTTIESRRLVPATIVHLVPSGRRHHHAPYTFGHWKE